MDLISTFLKKYSQFVADEDLLATSFPSACMRILGFDPTVSFKVNSGVIYCEGSRAEKNQIIMHKERIISLLESDTGRTFKDIR